VKRRAFITLLGGAAAWPLAARAQQKLPLVGMLLASTPSSYERYLTAFREGIRQLGYLEGQNIRFEYRFAEGDLARLPKLAIDLVALHPEVIVSSPLPAHLAARDATKTIPIVMATGADPVRFGLITSLAHPGGNITGLANFAEILAAKQIDILRELMPHQKRFGVLLNDSNPLHVPQLDEISSVADAAGITVMPLRAATLEQFASAFEKFRQDQAAAVLIPPDTVFYTFRARLAELAATSRLPAIYGFREHVVAGGLLSYGVDNSANYYRAASYVDKILRGSKAGDLPVEQPTKFELVINLKTAKQIGVDVPATLLARADEVIE